MAPQLMQAKAVILAGGVGSRVGLGIPKQFLKVAGKPLLHHTLDVFETSNHISEIIIMMNPDWLEDARKLVESGGFKKVSLICPGGETRNETTKNALANLEDGDLVLFHDAVRPLIDERIIVDCVESLQTYDAVDVVIPSADTLVVVDDDGLIKDIPNRSSYRRGQTPQGFRVSVLRAAYAKADLDPEFQATDDCSVVLKYQPDVSIVTVSGTEYNMKVTEPIDLFLVDKLFQVASLELDSRSLEERLEALRGKVAVVIGGSEGIGAAIVDQLTAIGVRAFAYSRTTTETDVADYASIERALYEANAEAGSIDLVVNTAGVLRVGQLAVQPIDEVIETVSINYLGAVNVARASYKYLAATKGHLLLFTSSSHTRGRADYSIYSSTKAAVVNLGQALADEWSLDNICVNVVNPERTSTPMRTKAFGEEDPSTLLSAEDVASSCIDVMSTRTTGHVIDVRVSQDKS